MKSGWLVVELMHEQILVWYVVTGNESKWLGGHQVTRACNDFSDSSTTRHCLMFVVKSRRWCIAGGSLSALRKKTLACAFLVSLKGDAVGLGFPSPPHPMLSHFRSIVAVPVVLLNISVVLEDSLLQVPVDRKSVV